MGAYLTRRVLLMVLTLFGMSVLIFVMLRLVPGNIADILVDSAGIADPKEKAKIAKAPPKSGKASKSKPEKLPVVSRLLRFPQG